MVSSLHIHGLSSSLAPWLSHHPWPFLGLGVHEPKPLQRLATAIPSLGCCGDPSGAAMDGSAFTVVDQLSTTVTSD